MKEGIAQGDNKNAYKLLKTFTKTGQYKTLVIEDSNGFLNESTPILN